jgi:hypothetical protein
MKFIHVVLIVAVILLVASCAKPKEGFIGDDESVLNESMPAIPEEKEGPAADEININNALNDVEHADEVSVETPIVNGSPVNTTPEVPVVTITPVVPTECPLITAENVNIACGHDKMPTMQIVEGACKFSWDDLWFSISAKKAKNADFDLWMDDNNVDQEFDELLPRTARLEAGGLKHFIWFTGSTLVEGISNSIPACNGDGLRKAVAKSVPNATMAAIDATPQSVEIDLQRKEVDNAALAQMLTMTYKLSGALKTVDEGNTTGTVKVKFDSGVFSLYATFKDLPDPKTKHYEGWVMKKTATKYFIINTGKLQLLDGAYKDLYRSGMDLSGYTTYFVTLEEDGKPGPSAHFLEGRMV